MTADEIFHIFGHYKFLSGCGYFTGILCFILAILIIKSDPKSKTCLLAGFMNVGVALWGFTYATLYLAKSDSFGLFNCQLTNLASVLISATFTHLVLVLVGKDGQQKGILLFDYLISGILIISLFSTNLIIQGTESLLDFTAFTAGGPLYFLIPLHLFSNLFYSITLLIQGLKKTEGYKRQQLQIFLVAIIIGFASGTPTFLPVYDIMVKPVMTPFVSLYSLLIFYAIIKHRFLDIRKLLKNTVVFGVLFGVLCFFVSFAFVVISRFITSAPIEAHTRLPGIFHPYVITGFLTAVVTLGLGLFVYFKNRQSSVHRAFLFMSLSIFEWSFFTALQSMQTEHSLALFWGRICHIGVMYIPVFFYYFSLRITGKENRKALQAGFAFASLLTLLMLFTPWFIPHERPDVGPNFLASAGPMYFVIILFFTGFVTASLARIWHESQISSGSRKKHLLYFFWSSVIGYGIGVVNFFPVYGLVFPPFPYSAACGALYFGVIAYAILKHKLFDIELFIKKSLVFGVLFLTVYTLVSSVIFFLGYFMAGKYMPLLSGFSIVLAMFLYEPLKALLLQLTNRFLFQKRKSYTALIEQLSERLSGIRDPLELSEILIDFLTHEMGAEWAGLYLLESEKGPALHLKSEQGHPDLRSSIETRSIAELFSQQRKPILVSPFDLDATLPLEIKELCRQEKAEAMAPVFVENELHGLILVGKKKSDREFTSEDETLLQAAIDQSSMLFLSARLLKTVTQSNLELGQRIKMAALTKLSRGVHHEIRNPLHAIALYASATLEDLKSQKPLEKTNLEHRIQAMLEEVDRVQKTLTRFAQFARPKEGQCLQPVNLKEETDRFFKLMKEGHKLDRVEIKVDIAPGLILTANEGSIQEILFNLFNNAQEAMEGKGTITISAREQNGGIEMLVRDSGPGIPEDVLPHVFEEYYTTKTDSESVGIGLTLTRHRLEEIGGSISIRNHPDGGTEVALVFQPGSPIKTFGDDQEKKVRAA